MTTITKTVKRYGNSGGVYLPADWIGGTARIELVEEPADPRKDMMKMPLDHVISVIAYGSYARSEMTPDSDIDLIVVVDDISKAKIPTELKKKYDLQVRTPERIKNSMLRDPIFHKSIKDGSVALVNPQFLESLKNSTEPDINGIRIYVDLAESALGIARTIAEESDDPTGMLYSAILHMKEMLIIECLFSGKKYSTKLLINEITRHAGRETNNVMKVYRSIRDDKKYDINVPREIVFKLLDSTEAKIKNVKQKTSKKKH
ncbi:MAG: nucleotidyltransferase domain-containing protein [Candidatus Aenigmarchaeota archaeon]|nr:nucleotidyltransferase domain-containing protein [Candidatus Aenigmarchaeota archaeon]